MSISSIGDSVPKLAIVTTHPIQYQVPLWETLARKRTIKIKVFYASDHGLQARVDPQFGKSFSWDIPLLNGYEFEFLPAVKMVGLPGPVANRWPLGLGEKLEQERFHSILIHGYMTGASLAGYWHAQRLRLPILLRGESHLHQKRNPVVRVFKEMLLRPFLREVQYCLAIGQWNREYWHHYGVKEDRIRTTLYSVDNERFRDGSSTHRNESKLLRSRWGEQPGDTIFGYVGKFLPHKGIDVLLDAYQHLRAHRSDIRLIMIGSAPEESELHDRFKNIPVCTLHGPFREEHI